MTDNEAVIDSWLDNVRDASRDAIAEGTHTARYFHDDAVLIEALTELGRRHLPELGELVLTVWNRVGAQ